MTDPIVETDALCAPVAVKLNLRLPPVDDYRRPLIEPLGVMVLHASWFENRLISFLGLLLPFGHDTTLEQVAHELRFWNRAFLDETVENAIVDQQLVDDIAKFLDRVDEIRKRRHRLVHDAMEVGILPIGELGDGRGYRAVLLREEYNRKGTVTERRFTPITPDQVAAVAVAFYEAGMELDTFLGRLKS